MQGVVPFGYLNGCGGVKRHPPSPLKGVVVALNEVLDYLGFIFLVGMMDGAPARPFRGRGCGGKRQVVVD